MPKLSTLIPLRRPSLPGLGRVSAWWGEFFAYHGIWAPGVRLLRTLSVRVKLLIVVGIVALPMVPMAWYIVTDQQAVVRVATHRQAGVRLAAAAFDVASALEARRAAAESGRPLGEDPATARLAVLAGAAGAAIDAGLPLQQAWEGQRVAVERAVQGPPSGPALRADLLADGLRAATTLHHQVASAIELEATSDRALFAQARLALRRLPDVLADLGQLRALAHRHLSVTEPASADTHERLLRLASVAARVEHEAGHVGEDWQAAGGSVSAGAPLPEVRAYVGLVWRQLGPGGAATDMASLQDAYKAARGAAEAERLRLLHDVERRLAQQVADARQLHNSVLLAMAVSMLASLYLLYTFYLVMRGGLDQLNHQMNRMALGDLSARLTPLGVDEVAATMKAMTASLVRLSDLMAAVRGGVGAVSQASQQVALGNGDLAARQHDNAERVTTVVDGVQRYAAQLDACGRQVEAVVHEVQQLRVASARNRRQMQRLQERMAALRGKSREIGEIVTLMDNIAFRTNVLALNASVEASKAGEAGRGFAVVAQEVRSLAQRGASSAQRIGEIVARSAEDIEQSGMLAEETGAALAEADRHVDQIHHAMDDVAGLTRTGEQDSAAILEQVRQIKDSSEQSLRLVDQLAQASDALRLQGERLSHQVGQFKLS